MPTLALKTLDSGYVCFDRAQAVAAGARLSADFARAEPFPHVVIDDFIDRDLLRRVAGAFPQRPPSVPIETEYQHFKSTFMPQDIDSGLIRNLLAELTQEAMLGFVEAVTGIGHLVPDPYFIGAGLHETRPGGYLAVHADFNLSQRMRTQRRANLIVYLNDDWNEAWGGHLELWDRKARHCVKRVAPLMGRAVLFQTDLDGFHGHPQPLACPQDRARRSIAMYYFVAPENGIVSLPRRAADFRRATAVGAAPRVSRDWRRWAASLAVDATPPIVYRALRRLAGRGG